MVFSVVQEFVVGVGGGGVGGEGAGKKYELP